MARRNEFVEHVVEMLRTFGAVEARAMFGGWGLYHRGAFFALVADDALYFKVDAQNRPRFEAAGEGPFVFVARDGRRTAMSYHRPPDEALDNPDVMAEWARLGFGAALRAAAAKAKASRSMPSKRGPVAKGKPRALTNRRPAAKSKKAATHRH